jgi:hypothetical protein
MRKILFLNALMTAIFCTSAFAQNADSLSNTYKNTADALMNKDSKLSIGGYGEVHYNQPLNEKQKDLGTLDVHRIVMFLGYNFSKNTQFVSEIEYEYAKELWVEQAFLQHKINKYINLRAGLLLVPMGIINEYHEPTTFHGVERPLIDNVIAPSTWREIGAGFTGTILPVSLIYQAYVVSGPNGYDTKGIFNGQKGIREGRQKGSKAYMSSPNYTAKIEYFGIKNLNVGLSGYFGKSQSRLFNKLHTDSARLQTIADSSVIGISLIGADLRYQTKGIELRGQVYHTRFTNTEQYNLLTSVNGTPNDLGSSMIGYYAEIGYNVFRPFENIKSELIPFVRYEYYNTHKTVMDGMQKNQAYENTIITTGLTYRINKNAAFKTDLQFIKPSNGSKYTKTFNAGIAVMF